MGPPDPGGDASRAEGFGGTELSVGGLTPEQRQRVDESLRAQGIDATWLGTTLRVRDDALPAARAALDRARRGGADDLGGYPPPAGFGGYPPPAGFGGYPPPGGPPPSGGADGYVGGGYVVGGYGSGGHPPGGFVPGGYGRGPVDSSYGGGPFGPYGGYGYGYPAKKTNGLAIASLVLAIVAGFTCYFGIVVGLVALVLGFFARRQIRDRDEQGAGLALAGMIVGGLVSAFFAAVIVIAIVASVTSSTNQGRGITRVPVTPTTTRERVVVPGTSIPSVPSATNAPSSGAIRVDACPRVRSALRAFDIPETTDEAILNDAARTLHAELPLDTADDIDLVLVDSRPRAGRDNTGARPSDVQAALDRLADLIDEGCPT